MTLSYNTVRDPSERAMETESHPVVCTCLSRSLSSSFENAEVFSLPKRNYFAPSYSTPRKKKQNCKLFCKNLRHASILQRRRNLTMVMHLVQNEGINDVSTSTLLLIDRFRPEQKIYADILGASVKTLK